MPLSLSKIFSFTPSQTENFVCLHIQARLLLTSSHRHRAQRELLLSADRWESIWEACTQLVNAGSRIAHSDPENWYFHLPIAPSHWDFRDDRCWRLTSCDGLDHSDWGLGEAQTQEREGQEGEGDLGKTGDSSFKKKDALKVCQSFYLAWQCSWLSSNEVVNADGTYLSRVCYVLRTILELGGGGVCL